MIKTNKNMNLSLNNLKNREKKPKQDRTGKKSKDETLQVFFQ